jgi:hypothetical protein
VVWELGRPCRLTTIDKAGYRPLRRMIRLLVIAVIWASGRDDALGTPSQHPYYLNERKLSRSSSEKDCGCSHAAKWPPFTISL